MIAALCLREFWLENHKKKCGYTNLSASGLSPLRASYFGSYLPHFFTPSPTCLLMVSSARLCVPLFLFPLIEGVVPLLQLGFKTGGEK